MNAPRHLRIGITQFAHWSVLIEVYLARSDLEIIFILSCIIENLTLLFNRRHLLGERLLKIGWLCDQVRLRVRLLWTYLKRVALIVIQKLIRQIGLSRGLILTDCTILLKVFVVEAFTELACRRRRIVLLLEHLSLILPCLPDDSIDLIHSICTFDWLLSTWWLHDAGHAWAWTWWHSLIIISERWLILFISIVIWVLWITLIFVFLLILIL